MHPLRIFLFGAPRIEQNDKIIAIPRRKVVALLAYLAVTDQPQSRDTLAALLWPDHDQSGARANLRRDLSRLRRILGDDALTVDRSQIALAADFNCWLDVAEFRAALAAVRTHDHSPPELCPHCLTQLTAASALYTADFLAGFSLPECQEFDEWLFFEAEGLRQALSEMLQILMQWHTSQKEFTQSIEYARGWLSLDSLHEPAHRELMQLYAWHGQQAAALRQYQECVRLLEEELGVEPEEETTALYEAIKSRQHAPQAKNPQTISRQPRVVPPPGAVLTPASRYVQKRPLTSGGHGQLFLGRDKLTNKPVVIKQLKQEIVAQDPMFVNRFTQESEMLRQLKHPNIVRMLTTFEKEGKRSIVMEYVRGGSLRQRLEQQGHLPLDEVLTTGLELADALSRAHHLGIIHRDIKPDNVLLATDGTPRLTDFGTARLLREEFRLTPGGAFLGSPAYMSPEALQGIEPDARSDIWSLGVMLFEMITGQRPFFGEQIAAILVSILNDPLPDLHKLRPDLPLALINLLQQMMAKNPAQRIPSMRQVAATLEAIRSGKQISPLPSPLPVDELTSPAAVPAAPHNLTLPPTPFIGREEELARIRQLLAKDPTCRLLTLVGTGGIGKTRLAAEAAQQLLPNFPNGAFFISLAPVSEPAHLISTIAATIGLQFSGAAKPKMQLLHYLRQRKILLLLDNFEHLYAGADLLSEILALTEEVKLLVTSRERLNLPEEWNYEMAGLPYPRQQEEPKPEKVEAYAAVQLFVQRAQRADAAFSLTPADAPAILRICKLVDGMPLGLELAAPWIRTMTCPEIAEEIARNLDFLTTTSGSVPDRHRSLRVIFEQSWQKLAAAERAICSKLAIFRGGCLREAAEQVAGAALPQLSLLVERSLLRRDRRGRYEMHELIRQFALTELQANPETFQAVQQRHSAYYLHFLTDRTEAIKGDGQTAVLAEIAAEIDNIRLAWRQALTDQNEADLEPAITAFWLFSEFRGVLHEGETAFGEAVTAWTNDQNGETAVPSGSETLVGFLLAGQGSLLARRGWFEPGQGLMQRGLALLRQASVTDKTKEAFALAWLAFSYVTHGRYEDAQQAAQESLALYPHTQDKWTQAGCLRLLGAAALHLGQIPEAEHHLQACLATCQEIGERRIRTYAILNLGIIATMRGETVQAGQLLDEALQISQEMADKLSQAAILIELGRLATVQGDYDQAVQTLQESLSIQQNRSRSHEGTALSALGTAYRLQHNRSAAERAYRDSLAMSKALGILPNVAHCLSGLGHLAFDQGQYVQAEQAQLEALAIWQDIGNEPEMALTYRYLGHIILTGDSARRIEAQRYYQQALEWARQYGLAPLALDLFVGLAEMLLPEGDMETAVTLLSLAQTHTAATAATRQQAAELLAKTTAHLSPAAVQAAVAQRPDWQDAAALVLEKLAGLHASIESLIPSNLPAEQTPFFGRETELAQLQKMLTTPDCRLVTVVGLGGMGKSRLALEAARQVSGVAERPFRHGVFFVSLVGVSTADAVPTAIADVLNLSLIGSSSPQRQIVHLLAQKELLLLLDNFEQLLEDSMQSDAAVGLVTAVLDGCPGVKLLLTSREALQLAAEWQLPLEGLAYARDQVSKIDSFEATQLFVQTAVQVQPDFVLTPDLAPQVRRICQLTAGTPLALKLAATWLRAIPLTQIATEIEQSLDILATNMRDVPARQRSMRAVFDHTWELLSAPEQAAFQGLSIFRGGFMVEAAKKVSQVSSFLLAGLVDRGLVQVRATPESQSGGAARYELHELARQYAAERLSVAEGTAVADAHAAYFANFVQQRYRRIQQRDYQAVVDELTVELNNVNAAWRWLLTNVDDPARADFAADLLGKMAPTLKHFYYLEGPLHSARHLFLEAAETMQAAGWETDADDEKAQIKGLALARMQVRAAFFSFGISDYETADRLLPPVLAWLRRAQVVNELALALSVLGKCHLLRGERRLAEEITRESISLLEQTDELYEYADALKVLGIVEVDDGRYDAGMAYYEQSLALHRQADFLPGIQQLLHNMGTTHFRQGNYEPAAQFYREALAVAEQGGIRRGIMHTSDALGGVQRILGNYQDSVTYHKKGITLARELGEQRWLAATLNSLGHTYVEIGDLKTAVNVLNEGLDIAWKTENVPDALASLAYLAQAWAQQGRVDAAFGLALFLADRPEVRANIKSSNQKLVDELHAELQADVVAAAQRWATTQTLAGITAVVPSGPPNIFKPANPS